MDCFICHDGEDCEVGETCPNCGRITKDVEFQEEKYKHFFCKEEAEEYREFLHGNDCMNNERFCYVPSFLDGGFNLIQEEIEWHNNSYVDYCNAKEQGCGGFMDEYIFVGNQMAKIGCNFIK